jgi:hypothetical protein
LKFFWVRRQYVQAFTQLNLFHRNPNNRGTLAAPSETSCKEAPANPPDLGMSQGEMVKRLGVQDLIHYTNISKYELDKNEPPLAILLAYARLAGIPVEQIIDDELKLTI